MAAPTTVQRVTLVLTGPDREKFCEGPCCVWHAMEPNFCGLPQASCSLLWRDDGVFCLLKSGLSPFSMTEQLAHTDCHMPFFIIFFNLDMH